MEIFIAILIFIAVVIVAALVFGGWLIVATVRLIGRALGGIGGTQSYPGTRMPPLPNLVRCEHAGCLAENPRRARFCRRCGRALGACAIRVVQRAALF
jgi:hypothetical protein